MAFAGNDQTSQLTRSFLVDIATAAVPVYPFSGYSIELDFQGSVPTADQTITLGSVVYIWKAAPSTSTSTLVEVDIGATNADCVTNLIAAITFDHGAGTGEGTLYGTGTVAHPDGYASPSGGLLTNAAHFTSLTKLDISETSSQFSFNDMYAVDNARTEMVQYANGDYTASASHSAARNLAGCQVVGLTPRGKTAGTVQGLYLTDHAGLPAMFTEMKLTSTTEFGGTRPLMVRTGAGLAAYWEATGQEAYVHWVGGRDISNV